ncbi:MAG TPA: carbon storage regulator [Caulifigura sp.]|jgi:carbon storage regulator|nr:carbon storage regulator [Caulifigura sp.]
MLMLGRKPGQSIYIGDDIVIKFVVCSEGYTRVGIEAPRHLAVLRSELRERMLASGDLTPADSGKEVAREDR